MNHRPAISICIPAYKNSLYLARLLDSISIQEFKDFEVIIADDSPDDELHLLAENYCKFFTLTYYKNETALGSPANWNKAINMARGCWIKIMHDDDWFTTPHALGKFYEIAKAANNSDFIFSGFINYDLYNGRQSSFVINMFDKWMLQQSPLYLFRTNYIGHPSTTLIRNRPRVWFDVNIKWVVDIEFYIRVLGEGKEIRCIPEPLVYIGVGLDQITKEAFRNPSIEIPENLYLLEKLGVECLKNIFVFDYYWRLIRNLKVRSIDDLLTYVSVIRFPLPLVHMIKTQQKFNQDWLRRSGLYSKIIMCMSYLLFHFYHRAS